MQLSQESGMWVWGNIRVASCTSWTKTSKLDVLV